MNDKLALEAITSYLRGIVRPGMNPSYHAEQILAILKNEVLWQRGDASAPETKRDGH